ncbi:MAG: DoxX family membrane protein [Nanoarchaeota archaeon]|nr:DoxX family membrane protein [Nanoarchaeota archaeon]
MDKKCSMAILQWFFGIAFALSGLAKILGFSMMQGFFGQLFGSLGTILLVIVIIAELGGGLLLLFNKWVRKTSLVLMAVMIVAVLMTLEGKFDGNVLDIIQKLFLSNIPFLYLVGTSALYFGSE